MADVLLNSPEGEVRTVDSADAQNALQNGWTAATPEQQQAYTTELNKQAQFGEGIENELKSAALGAGEMATFGLSNQALVKSGLVNPETIKEIEERNPVSHVVGSVAGLVADPLGALGLVSKAGKGVSAGTRAILPEATTAAGKVIQNIGTAAVGSAVEGAAFGAGNAVNEQALGDPDLNSEKLLSHVGYGTILGGGLGGLLKAGEVALPASYNAFKNSLNKVYDVLAGNEEAPGLLIKGYAKVASAVSDTPYEDIIEASLKRGEPPPDPKQFASVLQDSVDTAQKLTRDVYNRVKDEDISSLLKDHDANLAKDKFFEYANNVDQKVQQLIKDDAPKRIINELQNVRDRLIKSVDDESTSADIYASLNKAKQEIDPLAKFEKGSFPTSSEKYAIDSVRELRDSIKRGLEDESTWGSAAARQASLNSSLTDYLKNFKDFQKQFMVKSKGSYVVSPLKVQTYLKQIGNVAGDMKGSVLSDFVDSSRGFLKAAQDSYENLPNKEFNAGHIDDILTKSTQAMEDASQGKFLQQEAPSSLLKDNLIYHTAEQLGVPGLGVAAVLAKEVHGVLANPGAMLGRLGNIERLVNKATVSIENLSGKIFKAGVSGAQKAKGAYINQSIEDKRKEFNKIQKQINAFGDGVDSHINHLDNVTKDMYSAAPNTTGSMQTKLVNATMFLKSKMPLNESTATLSPPIQPSNADLSKFFRYYDVVSNPTIVLEQVKSGTLSPESMETMQQVYPELLKEMQMQVISKLSESNKKAMALPYSTKMMLSMFLGQDLVNGLNSQNILNNQIAINGPSKQVDNQITAATQAKPSKTGQKELTIANRTQTDLRAAQTRERA